MCLKAEKVFAMAVHDELPQIASNIGQQLSVRADQIEFDRGVAKLAVEKAG